MSTKIYVNRDGIPPLPSGEWAWVVKGKEGDPFYLAFGCPCGNNCDSGSIVHNNYISVVRGKTNTPHQWGWDGNWDSPTLSPSIQRHGACNWHGYLRNGVFTQ